MIGLFSALINLSLTLIGKDMTASLIAMIRVTFDRIRDEELRKMADDKYEKYKWDWDQQREDRDHEE